MNIKYGKRIDNKIRTAVRGVLIKDNLIGVIKVDKYDCIIFPGGGVDEGENLEDALIRELQEEAGYEIVVKEHLLTTETAEWKFTHINHFYLCEIVGNVETSHTEEEIDLGIHFEWIPIEELYKYYLNYETDNRFGKENSVVQKSIKTRGFLLLSLLNKKLNLELEELWLGKQVDMIFDRPANGEIINYGYIEDIFSLDGGEVDCYYLDSLEPLKQASGRVVAVVKRKDDVEDKLVVSNKKFNIEEIAELINFNEQYFDSEIIMEEYDGDN